MADTVLVILFALNLIVCAVFFVLSLVLKRRRYLLYSLFMFCLPLAGGILLAVSHFTKIDRRSDTEYYAEFTAEKNPLHIVDRKKELHRTSITDVLLFNDVKTKREVVLDIFRSDSEQFIKELKLALNDPDTEVSHYASTALSEIKRKYDNSLIALRAELERDKDNTAAKLNYANVIYSYLESDMPDQSGRVKYKRLFCGLVKDLLEDKVGETYGADMKLYKALVLYLLELGEEEQAMIQGELVLESFPSATSYFALLELYFRLKRREEFFFVMNRLKNSPVRLSKEQLEILRYFQDTVLENGGNESLG